MAKKTLKVKCESVNQNANRGTVQFSPDAETVTPDPGKPPVRQARTAISFSYGDPKEVAGYVVGKEYTITIDG